MSNGRTFDILADNASGPLTEKELYDFARIVSNPGGFARTDYLAEKIGSRFGFTRLPHVLRYEGARDYLRNTIEFVTRDAMQEEPSAIMACCQVARTQEQAYAQLFPSEHGEFEAAVRAGYVRNIATANQKVSPAPLQGWNKIYRLLSSFARKECPEVITELWETSRAKFGEKMVVGNMLNPGIVIDLSLENQNYIIGRVDIARQVSTWHMTDCNSQSLDLWTGQIIDRG